MKNAIVKASKEVRNVTSNVRHHLDVVERAREIYLAQMKRAESEYFERIKRATEVVVGNGADTSEAVSEVAPVVVEPAA